MKKLVFLLLFLLLFSFSASAETSENTDLYGGMYETVGAEELEEMLPDDTRELLGKLNVDISDSGWVNELTFDSVWEQILGFFRDGARHPCGAAVFVLRCFS